MHNAAELMTTELVTVAPETPIMEAAKLLVEKKISGLPVVSEDGTLVGVLSEKDVLKLLFETLVFESSDHTERTVSEFMTKRVISFEETDSIVDICEFFIKNHIRRVPIVRKDRLIGVISRRDIVSEIIRLRAR